MRVERPIARESIRASATWTTAALNKCLHGTGTASARSGLPDAATLAAEMQNYQVKISEETAHDSYGAWRTGTHDDLLFAVMLPVWCATGLKLPFSVLAMGKARRKTAAVAADLFDRGTHY